MRKSITRRSLLGAAGAGLGSLWLPAVNRLHAADAASAGEPNLLFLYADGGWVSKDVHMRPPWAPAEWSEFEFYEPGKNQPDDTEWEFEFADSRLSEADFSRILRPFYRHREVMTVVEGLSMSTTALDTLGDDHARAHIHVWSAVPAGSSEGVQSFGSAPSVDQRINEFIQASRPDHRSMDFNLSTEIFHQWLYRTADGGAAIVPVITDPSEGFDRFFSGVMGGGSQAESDPLTDNARYSLDLAIRQFDDMAPRMSAGDRAKLEAHRELLAGVQRRFGQTISCDASNPPTSVQGEPGSTEWYNTSIDAFAQLVATGFACGISRVASIGGLMAPNGSYGLDPGASVHQEYEHAIDPVGEYELGGGELETFTSKRELMVQRNIIQAEAVARVIDVLKSAAVGEGSLLDNTLVVYMSEISHGNHGHEYHPTIMFGSGGGIVTPGRYIKYPINLPRPSLFDTHINTFGGDSHSRLLVAILQGFGVDIDYLGAPSLEGHTGTIDISGPLPRLKV